MTEKYTLFVLGAFAVCYGVVCALRLKQSAGWSGVSGLVIKSVKKSERTDAGRLEYADVEYEYFFNGKRHTSKTIKIGGDMLSNPSKNASSEADKLLNEYRVGKTVEVYVNPKHPKIACLERSGEETVFASFFCGILALTAGFYFEEITDFIFAL